MLHHPSLGIPPLGGIATYEEAARTGLSVAKNVEILKRYAYTKRRLMEIILNHLCATAEWEVKCAYSLHHWLDVEHATLLRQRVAEMRKPPLHLDKVPDERLEAFLDEVLHSRGTRELLVAVYRVVRPALLSAYQRHLAETNPLADYPTCRHLRAIIGEEEEMIAWGEAALAALLTETHQVEQAATWATHLQAYLAAAGGMWGDAVAPAETLPAPRAAEPFVMDLMPQRDERFSGRWDVIVDRFVDYEVWLNPSRTAHERTIALMYKRLREMNVPEMMATIIVQSPGKPWDYYRDMTRQLWDECRHAMMGEAAFESLGYDWTKLSNPIDWSYILNVYLTAAERHAVLLSIEEWLMRADTGKPAEWETATSSGIPLAATFQDYDWADEVLHAQIGRRRLVADLGDRAAFQQVVEQAIQKETYAFDNDPLLRREDITPWWPEFYAPFVTQDEHAKYDRDEAAWQRWMEFGKETVRGGGKYPIGGKAGG
jgi:hypothetical protein